MFSHEHLRRVLGPELSTPVSWPAADPPLPDNEMTKVFKRTENVHKTAHFLDVYDTVFAPFKDQPIKILEIGVACGGSLAMWRDYFCDDATVVGVDANPQCTKFDNPDRKLFVRQGFQQDVNLMRGLVDEFGPFDIILDDGSHLPSYTLTTFQYMFLNGLNDNGVYLVEDLEWCYMPCGLEPFEDRNANDGTPTFTEVAKALIDVMHVHYRDRDTEMFQKDHPTRLPEVTVPLATTLISRIDMHDGIVAVHRKSRHLPRLLFQVDPDYLAAWLAEDERIRRQWS